MGATDEFNVRLFAAFLALSYGSQLYLCAAANWPILSSSSLSSAVGMIGSDDDDGSGDGGCSDTQISRGALTIMVVSEAAMAAALAAACLWCLKGGLWFRVRVVYMNRASLWLTAAARARQAPQPGRILPPSRRPSSRPHQPSVEPTPEVV